MLTTVAVSGYRSLRDVVVPLHGLDVVTGANGSGKSSLYRALRLLAGCGRGDVVGTLAREGGLPSALWAGPATLGAARREGHAVQGTTRRGPVSLRLGFASDDLGYLVDLGLPQQASGAGAVDGPGGPAGGADSAFLRDPEIKREVVWSGPVMRPGAVLVRRRWGRVETRAPDRPDDGWEQAWGAEEWESDPAPTGRLAVGAGNSGGVGAGAVGGAGSGARGWVELTRSLRPWESMLTELADPDRAPELLRVRRLIRGWRFYDSFRADAAAPARPAHIGTRTPVLSDDGHDLAAALQTIRENGRSEASSGRLPTPSRGRSSMSRSRPDASRWRCTSRACCGRCRVPSSPTARCATCCSSPRCSPPDPPPLLVLNEPETSLHPDLLSPLARLIRSAAERSQVMVVSHSSSLVSACARRGRRRGGRPG